MKTILSILLFFFVNVTFAETRNLTAEVWVDNWFEMSINGEKVMEDSVQSAVEHSESAVRPKDGYDRIQWDRSSRLIWSNDLVQDNTLLCRLQIVDR